jgi:hypothetical protein
MPTTERLHRIMVDRDDHGNVGPDRHIINLWPGNVREK